MIVAAYNASATLDASLESVARQALRPAAVIVIDDGSTDATAAVASSHSASVVRRSSPGGAAVARNAGLRAAATEFCALLDADDHWHEDHLVSLRSAVEAHPQAALWFGGSVLVAPDGRFAGTLTAADSPGVASVRDLLLRRARATTSATLVRRDVVLDLGGFDEHEDFRPASCEDLDLWLRLAQRYELRPVLAITATYRVSDDRRPPATLRANERARVRIVERAIIEAQLVNAERRAVWSVTLGDLAKWHLKHGTRSDAQRCLVAALAQSPWQVGLVGWLALALLPDPAAARARSIARWIRWIRHRRR